MTKLQLLAALCLIIGMTACQRQPDAGAFAPSGPPSLTVDFAHAVGNWCKLRSEEWGDYYCMNGELNLMNHAVNPSGQRITPMGGGHFKNIMVQAAVRSVSQSGSYGIGFRGPLGPVCCYIFRVRPSGDFELFIAETEDVVLLPWTPSTAIRKGGTVNLLQVRAQGSRITLFANGVELASVENDVLSEGSVGIVASEDGQAAASRLEVWELP